MESLNQGNNGFTWMEYCTKGCHKMSKYGIFKITNGETLKKWHVLFRVGKIFF